MVQQARERLEQAYTRARRLSQPMALLVAIWSGITLALCSHGVYVADQQNPGIYDTPGGAIGGFLAMMLWAAIWAGGLGVLALLKYLFGHRRE